MSDGDEGIQNVILFTSTEALECPHVFYAGIWSPTPTLTPRSSVLYFQYTVGYKLKILTLYKLIWIRAMKKYKCCINIY